MATKKNVNVDDALETAENVTETVTENVTENAENVTENVANSTTKNAEIAADETPSVSPETVDETEKAKQPLSLEDALAAAEFAAGQYESFAAEEKAEVRIPEFYHFGSIEERERILYQNFCRVGEEVKEMIAEIQRFRTR